MNDSPIAVGIADAHPLIRAGMVRVIGERDDMRLVGEAATADEVPGLVQTLSQSDVPGVLVLGLNFPAEDGLGVLDEVTKAGQGVCVVTLGGGPAHRHLFDALDRGAAGFVSKSDAVSDLLNAIHTGAEGAGCVISPTALSRLSGPGNEPDDAGPLTPREFEVLGHVAQGASNREVSDNLCISPHTVKNHVTSILAKLEIRSRSEAIVWMWERDLVPPL